MNKLNKSLKWFGLNFPQMKDNIKGLFFYFSDLTKLKKQLGDKNFGPLKYYPILNDRLEKAGSMSGHYFHQDLLVAEKIFKNKPDRHIDIGSRIDGFVAHVASFRKIEIFDIRNQKNEIVNIAFNQLDLMAEIPPEYVSCTDSISSLHAIEHFGLGRYGDPIELDGHLKGLNNIKKILRSSGKFYFSVPIGTQRIEFNAHRVFSLQYLRDVLLDDYTLISFSYVDDSGNLHKDVDLTETNIANNLNCRFGCGIFELLKK